MGPFQEINVWQKSKALYVDLYNDFSGLKEFYFKDQILRAALSISNNIAEGHDRKSDKEYARFLYISKGSASEVHSMLIVAEELKFLNHNKVKERINQVIEVSKMLGGLIKTVSKGQSDNP